MAGRPAVIDLVGSALLGSRLMTRDLVFPTDEREAFDLFGLLPDRILTMEVQVGLELDLGRGLIARGLRSPRLVVSDGAPGLVRAIGELWPDADRQRCTVHRIRNVLAKLPERGDVKGNLERP